MSSTKNTKDNRQVVRATYHAPESIFKIPDGLDLNDKSVVEDWGVKWNKLYITYVNGEKITIAPTWDAAEHDWKRPAECEITPAEDTGYCYSEEESDDEEEEKCEICGKTEKDCINEGLEFDTGCLSIYFFSNKLLCPDCIPHESESEEEEHISQQ